MIVIFVVRDKQMSSIGYFRKKCGLFGHDRQHCVEAGPIWPVIRMNVIWELIELRERERKERGGYVG